MNTRRVSSASEAKYVLSKDKDKASRASSNEGAASKEEEITSIEKVAAETKVGCTPEHKESVKGSKKTNTKVSGRVCVTIYLACLTLILEVMTKQTSVTFLSPLGANLINFTPT